VFASEVAEKFPAQADGFRDLVAAVRTYDDVSLDAVPVSAREVVRRHISDPLLEDMLFCPLMYYGSATERDMEFGQFVIMFKALFLEGFARPFDGVRVVLRVLLEKYRAAGGERRMKCGVKRIISREGRATALVLDTDEEITANHVISSIGAPETEELLATGTGDAMEAKNTAPKTAPGPLSFVETISILREDPLPGVVLPLFLEALAEHAGEKLLRVKGIIRVAEVPEKPAVLHGVRHVLQQGGMAER
jgi:phytoene dehydrogenase-like protein